MKERFRDKTRDELTDALCSLGVKAEMAERGRLEENVHKSAFRRSLGVIDLADGPVRWINIVKQDGSDKSPPQWWINFCIPYETATSVTQDIRSIAPPIDQDITVKTVRKKTFPLFGKVVSVAWTGDDYSTGLIRTLSDDREVSALAKRRGDLEIRSYSKEFRGWTLQVNKRVKPSRQDWAVITKIADHLLSLRHGL